MANYIIPERIGRKYRVEKMKRKANSYFVELLKKFTLILCIPLIAMLILFWRADKILKEQVLDSATKSLNLYSEQMDIILESVQSTCRTIFTNEKVNKYYTKTIGSYQHINQITEISQFLDTLIDEKICDVFVYFYADDRIVSGVNGSLEAQYYYQAYFTAERTLAFEDEFMDVVKYDSGNFTCHVMNSMGEKPYLCMTMGTRNSRNPKQNYTVCVVMDPDYIESLFIMGNEGTGLFQMYNLEKEIVLNTGRRMSGTLPEGRMQLSDIGYGRWIEINGSMIQLKESTILKNDYAYIVEKGSFWNTLSWLRNSCIVIMLLSTLISIVVACESAKRAYSPLEDIMLLLPEKNQDEKGKMKNSEFAYLADFLKKSEKRNKKTKKELTLLKAMEGTFSEADKEIFQEIGDFSDDKEFVVGVLRIEEVGEEIWDLSDFIVQNVFEELCNAVGQCYFQEMVQGKYIFIVSAMGENAELYEELRKGLEFCKEYYQIVLTVGYSNRHKNLAQMQEAYREALDALRHGFLVGLGEIVPYGEIQERKNRYQSEREDKIYRILLDCIREEKNGVDDFLENMMYIYQIDADVSVDIAFFFKNKVSGALEKLMKMYKMDVVKCSEIMKCIQKTATFEEFREQLSLCILELREVYRSEVRITSKKELCKRAKSFIDENYADDQLSVNSLGEQIGIQAAYLSKIFKEEYGVSILNYIATVRISHAKRIMLEEGKTVQEVTKRTGFLSTQVFTRTFKKLEGITPGQYKEMTRKEDKLL